MFMSRYHYTSSICSLPDCHVVFQAPEQESSQPSADTELRRTLPENDSANDIDYFEKFTLVDVVGPGEQVLEDRETGQLVAMVTAEEPKLAKVTAEDSLPPSEDSFVIVSDVDIVGEHLDEVFYGDGAPADAPQQREHEAASGAGMRSRRESQRSAKESGSVLFETEETTLTPIYISPGPPKIIDPILLEEPTAMSFMYSDLYEDAVGERRKSDEEHSESESVASEKASKRRLSDSEEADGYLEKFILKDETPTVEVPPESAEDRREGRMMWAQSKFEMTGCLTRVAKEEDEVTKKTEETREQDVTVRDREEGPTAAFDERAEEMAGKTDRQSSRDKPIQESIVRDEKVKCEVRKDQSDTESSTDQDENADHQREKPAASKHSNQLCQTQEIIDQDVVKGPEEGDGAASSPSDGTGAKSEIPAEIPKETLSGEKAADAEDAVAAQSLMTGGQEAFAATEMGNSAKTSPPEGKEAATFNNVEVPADCRATAHAILEVNDKPVNKQDIQSEVHDLQEAGSTEKTEGLEPEIPIKAERETEGDGESSVTKPVTSEEEGRRSARNLRESKPHLEEELAAAGAPRGKTTQTPEAKKEKTTDDGGRSVQKKNAAEDFVLHVPKGKAVEMDIEISHVPKVTTDDGKPGYLTSPCVTMDTESPQLRDDGKRTEPQLEVKTKDVQEEKTRFSPPELAEDAIADQQKVERDQDGGVFSFLRSFTAQEDLSGLIEEETHSKREGEEVEISEVGDVTEGTGDEEPHSAETDVHSGDKERKMEPEEADAESPDVNAEELDYEVICEQEAKEMHEAEPQRDAEEPKPEPEPEKGSFDLSPEEEHIEDDYEIFDAEEERQARLAAELQGLDWFCFTCGDLLSRDGRASEEHRDHKVTDVDVAYEEIKVKHDVVGCIRRIFIV